MNECLFVLKEIIDEHANAACGTNKSDNNAEKNFFNEKI